MNDKQKIISLLCSSQIENIEFAKLLCDSQGFNLVDLLNEFGYTDVGITCAADFMKNWIDCSGFNLQKLPSLLPLSLTTLICSFNQLTALPPLPPKLDWIECNDNQLTTLPSLPLILYYLCCENNQLTTLPPLPNSLCTLNCQNNQLTTLPPLPNELESLYCQNNRLTTLPPFPQKLDWIDCSKNPLPFLNNKAIEDIAPKDCTVVFKLLCDVF
jgi:hypothetical protein